MCIRDSNYSIQGQQIFIFSKIKKETKATFDSIFGACENRIHAIVTFLALLELLNLSKLHLIQGEGINNFWLIDNLDDDKAVGNSPESTQENEENPALKEEAKEILENLADPTSDD